MTPSRITLFLIVSIIFIVLIIFQNSTYLDTTYAQVSNITEFYHYLNEWLPIGPAGESITLTDLAVDSTGMIYILDGEVSHVLKFDSNGTLVTTWGSYGDTIHGGEQNSKFDKPRSISIDSSDNVYILDSRNHRIQKFDSSGNFITKWGSRGIGNAQFNGPTDIAIDSDNKIYVSDPINNRVQKFNSDGGFITEWNLIDTNDGNSFLPFKMTIDSSDNVYVSDSHNKNIHKFDSYGNLILKWEWSVEDEEQFDTLDIAIDSTNNLYLSKHHQDNCDSYYDYACGYYDIQKFDTVGNFITKLEFQNIDEPFEYFTIDSKGNMYLMDNKKDELQILIPIKEYSDTNNQSASAIEIPSIPQDKTTPNEENPSIAEQSAGITDYA